MNVQKCPMTFQSHSKSLLKFSEITDHVRKSLKDSIYYPNWIKLSLTHNRSSKWSNNCLSLFQKANLNMSILKTYKHKPRKNKVLIFCCDKFYSLSCICDYFIWLQNISPKVTRQHTPIFKPTKIRTNKTMTIGFYFKTLSQTTYAGQILIYSLVCWIKPFITITFLNRNNAGQHSVSCIYK